MKNYKQDFYLELTLLDYYCAYEIMIAFSFNFTNDYKIILYVIIISYHFTNRKI